MPTQLSLQMLFFSITTYRSAVCYQNLYTLFRPRPRYKVVSCQLNVILCSLEERHTLPKPTDYRCDTDVHLRVRETFGSKARISISGASAEDEKKDNAHSIMASRGSPYPGLGRREEGFSGEMERGLGIVEALLT